ncbi:PREDICTED: proline-rich receptor-like protein kinase PERK3 [Rhinopithecus bieti]|uniref:proline-rich receptor-like protein kinase PERK3 n=1 Tax=Rhinopithecus bieti TaxID=61621 RepID=UPI00083BAC0E|nr:PREDICTED: proline-rich receptor-like protein kinase PERK3 [Rhinopithecus bieti]
MTLCIDQGSRSCGSRSPLDPALPPRLPPTSLNSTSSPRRGSNSPPSPTPSSSIRRPWASTTKPGLTVSTDSPSRTPSGEGEPFRSQPSGWSLVLW